MIEELPFTYLHVFTFSARPGTAAAAMPNQVPVNVARERNRILRNLAAEKKGEFMRSFVGHDVEAITLDRDSNPQVKAETSEGLPIPSSPYPHTSALTDNYLKLKLHGKHSSNCWLQARIEAVEQDSLVGRVA